MTAPVFSIPQHLHERQAKASDPATSVWVAANAGSGKTHVLTQRVIRLMLRGVAPAKILCLTFTKAAAAQMATRVFSTLSRWTQLEDADLRAAVRATGAPDPSGEDLLLARRLFTRTVETPGGLKIQTIHAFCERLLHLFPFEANVPARFEVADERRTADLLAQARQAAVADAKSTLALALLADIAGAAGIHPLIKQAMQLRATARRSAPAEPGALAERLGVAAFASVDAVRTEMLRGGLTADAMDSIALRLDQGSATDRKYAEALRRTAARMATDVPEERAAILKAHLTIFFDTKGLPRGTLMTKKLAAIHVAEHDALLAERDRLDRLRDMLKAVETVERTKALVSLADAVVGHYDATKARLGILDFDDLVDRTLALLDRSDAGWVLHKLDAGIDHVLVDEAQDTSATQWRILERLTGDFASGDGARSRDRTFFVVGDDKQSIFSFQGAAPLMFDTMRSSFERRFRNGRKAFERVALKTSFRSVPGILDAVDKVFEKEAHQDGLVAKGDVWPIHDSVKMRLPGLVEIWPTVCAVPRAEPEDWTIPLDTPPENDPVNILAERVARQIQSLIATTSPDRVHDGRGEAARPITAGDILILVRTRGAFFEAVIRALKRRAVAVAGADRLDVANHIAVMDLVAAGRAASMPDDDLTLACLLKSPLFDMTDDDLIALAPGRNGRLIDALGASSAIKHQQAHAMIGAWARRARSSTPFAFYVEILGRDGGRRKMEARLGPEAHDVIDEFLRLALAHERDGAPSLRRFLSEVEALDSSIKRDMEGPGDCVRVMTVHAAKGLEAKIVFLPDTCSVPAPSLDPTVFDLNDGKDEAPLLAWSPRKSDDPPAVAVARAEARTAVLREYRRLLYVALTRAEERLYICGHYNSRKPPEDCWSEMIAHAFPEADEVAAPWGEGDMVRRIVTAGSVPLASSPSARGEQRSFPLTPAWLQRPAPPEDMPAVLRPSSLRLDEAGPSNRAALSYGSTLHLLLQHLPTIEAARRAEAGRAFLASRNGIVPRDQHERLVTEVLRVMDLPALAPLFTPQARAEVPLVGRVVWNGRLRNVRGTVDRLVVGADEIIVADFKTGAPSSELPTSYIEQMALYDRVVAALWPDLRRRFLLVWTRESRVVELDRRVLAATGLEEHPQQEAKPASA